MKKERLEELRKIYERSLRKSEPVHFSPEFIQFLKAEVEKKTWYENLCSFCLGILRIRIGEEKRKSIKQRLDFCNLDIEPEAVYSAFVLSLVTTLVLGLLFSSLYFLLLPTQEATIKGLIPYLLTILILGVGGSYYILTYPDHLAKRLRVEASSELVLAILYMAIGLKHIPNLESAVTFAAINLSGVLGRDLRKVLWDIRVGRYVGIEDGLESFAKKWKFENEEFSKSIDLLRISTLEPVGREKTIERAVTLILRSNMERMKAYARELKNPITIIHGLGILLPVITLIMFPIVTIFLPEVIKPYILVALYDVILPIVVFWFMMNTLQKRPFGFLVADISGHPKAAKSGEFVFDMGKRKVEVPLLPISILLAGLISLPGILTLMDVTPETSLTTRIFAALFIFWGIVIAIVLYTILANKENRKIKQEIEGIESEFGDTMYLLGTVMRTGQPLEVGLEKVNERITDQKISGLFDRMLYGMRNMGMTLREAVLNEEYGVVKYYPSRLIRNTLVILVESTKKGYKIAGSIMMAISKYLKSVHEVDETLKELLEETTSSMKLMLSLLVPLVAGVVVGMASILISILLYVAKLFLSLPIMEETGGVSIIGLKMGDIMPIEVFLLVVGAYLIEMLISLSMFTVQLEKGEDRIEMQYAIGVNLLKGSVIFTVILLIIHFLFGGLIPFG